MKKIMAILVALGLLFGTGSAVSVMAATDTDPAYTLPPEHAPGPRW